jgi:hypothetical protein
MLTEQKENRAWSKQKPLETALARWPRRLILKVRKLKAHKTIEPVQDVRTALTLKGIGEMLPEQLFSEPDEMELLLQKGI